MFAKESLYINAIKYKAQLKINYKKLKDNEIVETNTSTFIAKDDILNRDIANKLTAQSSQLDKSYISTLLLQEDTKLLKKTQAINSKDYKLTSLNDEYNVAVSKNTLFETKNYFEKCGIDYIFSAYHILNLHIEQNPCNNNLIVLLFNNQAFCLILDKKGQIVFNKTISIITFEEIKESDFYENDILGQKLFDEMYALELHESINKTIEEFYSITKNIFIEKVSLLYNLKQLTEEEVKKMSDAFMIDVTYHPISVDEELFELSKDNHCQKSFIKPRTKDNTNLKNWIATFVVLGLLCAIGYLFIPFNELMKKEETIEQQQEKVITPKIVKLPDHKEKNSFIKNRVTSVFGIIPYDMVLKDILFSKDSMKMDTSLLNKDTFIKTLQPELNKIYMESNIEVTEINNSILDGVISAKNLKLKFKAKTKDYKETYILNEFMPIIRVTEQLKMLFPKGTIINFKSNFKSEVVTFNYLVNVIVQSPKELFEIIDNLNNELYSINISYPLSFIKTDAGIEVEFTLQFHQPK